MNPKRWILDPKVMAWIGCFAAFFGPVVLILAEKKSEKLLGGFLLSYSICMIFNFIYVNRKIAVKEGERRPKGTGHLVESDK